jgi:hypothetical protein
VIDLDKLFEESVFTIPCWRLHVQSLTQGVDNIVSYLKNRESRHTFVVFCSMEKHIKEKGH